MEAKVTYKVQSVFAVSKKGVRKDKLVKRNWHATGFSNRKSTHMACPWSYHVNLREGLALSSTRSTRRIDYD